MLGEAVLLVRQVLIATTLVTEAAATQNGAHLLPMTPMALKTTVAAAAMPRLKATTGAVGRDSETALLTMPAAAAALLATAAIEPATMKVRVKTMERGERRALPQMPCPDVQPLPVQGGMYGRDEGSGGQGTL